MGPICRPLGIENSDCPSAVSDEVDPFWGIVRTCDAQMRQCSCPAVPDDAAVLKGSNFREGQAQGQVLELNGGTRTQDRRHSKECLK
jgi:hypothetical protein